MIKERRRQMGEGQGGEETHRGKLRKIDDTLAPIIIQVDESESRVVFVPSTFAAGQPRGQVEQVSVSSTVLVPLHEDAIDEIGSGAFERAFRDKSELKSLIELFSKQGLRTDIKTGLSVMWRALLLDVQTERLNMWNAMGKGKGKGEILDRKSPKKAKVTEENPLWPLTKRECLKKSFPWAQASINQKEDESKSTSYVNGQVKTLTNFIYWMVSITRTVNYQL